MATLAIETHGLTRDFDTVRAVDDLTIEVEQGTVFGFLGPNGSGKTTTIRLLLGLIPPTSGSATVLGFDCATQGDEIRARTGALLEHPGLYERLTAEENLDFFARIWRLSPDERARRIKALLGHLGLWERRTERIVTWSRGMRQKLAIARALLHHPALVFLDEPTAGLDPVASAALRRDLNSLAKVEGVTVFLTTHNLSEAEKLCDRVAVIRGGVLVGSGSTRDLLGDAGSKRVAISVSSMPTGAIERILNQTGVFDAHEQDGVIVVDLYEQFEPAAIVRLLVELGAEVQEVRPERVDLEDAFLTLVAAQDAG
jgi:ABC-2 type transport system ATP-binding protein